MSRGPGRLQRFLFQMVRGSDKPLTFVEMLRVAKPHEQEYRPHRERSLRRALKRLVDDSALIAIGAGGPGDPKRYCVNPMLIAMAGSGDEWEKTITVLEREPGGTAAANRAARAMF